MEEILVGHGDDATDVRWYIHKERVRVVGGEGGGGGSFYDGIKCWEASLRYSKMPLWIMYLSPLLW